MLSGRVMNEVVSLLVFSMFDILDMLLCLVYKIVDLVVEADWRPKETITSSGNILPYERGESKVVCLPSKLQLEDISDTLYTRSSIASTVMEFRRRIREEAPVSQPPMPTTAGSTPSLSTQPSWKCCRRRWAGSIATPFQGGTIATAPPAVFSPPPPPPPPWSPSSSAPMDPKV